MSKKLENQVLKEFSQQAKQMASSPAFHAEPVLQWLVSAVSSAPGGRVLDLACGPGIVAEAIAPHSGEVVGIDLMPEMIRLARARLENANPRNGQFSVARAERLPFTNACFDQIITRLSFHHFGDVATVLAEIRRVLRRDGRLVVADVISSENEEESALHNSLERLRDPTHVRMFTRTQLLRLIRAGGFEILQEEGWEQARSFGEWAAIIANPTRTEPLEHVMRVLARQGQMAGINLREQSGEVHFTHTWLFLIAQAG